jgi:uncharacterized protein
MDLGMLAGNFLHPPVLFFFLGLLAVAVKSDLEIPHSTARFFSLYLLFHIGFEGGVNLRSHGIDEKVIGIILVCILGSFIMPFLSYHVLKKKLDVYNAGAVAATYGSISAVTFAIATSFLNSQGISFGGYMVAGMALMESPAIVAGLICISLNVSRNQSALGEGITQTKPDYKRILHESFTNGSVLLLLGSLAIGLITGEGGETELKPFVTDIYKGFLTLFMLDMGLIAGKRIGDLKKSGRFLVGFGLIYPFVGAIVGMSMATVLQLELGDAFLLTTLFASASYIAVPAAMRMAVPEASMSIMLPMALGVTFTFNISLGIPIYFSVLKWLMGLLS